MKPKQNYRRGYPVALLVGFEEAEAVVWHVFSHVIKLHYTLKLQGDRTNERALYNFFESVIEALKPTLKEGVRSILIAAPTKTSYAEDFLSHVRRHHSYLIQSNSSSRATFAKLAGSADQPSKVTQLVKTREFHDLVAETTSGEADGTIETLEKSLYSSPNDLVLFSLREIEEIIYDQVTSERSGRTYLLLTDQYLTEAWDKNRVQRLLQIAQNKKVKTRIVKAETAAGQRISQLGGLVFFITPGK